MEYKEYNGWYNYETWCFGLYHSLDNFTEDIDRIRKDYKREIGDVLTDKERQIIQFSEVLKNYMEIYEDQIPKNGIISDLIDASISEINYREIAEGWFEDYLRNEDDNRI